MSVKRRMVGQALAVLDPLPASTRMLETSKRELEDISP